MNRQLGLGIAALMACLLIVLLVVGVPHWYALGPIILAGVAVVYSREG